MMSIWYNSFLSQTLQNLSFFLPSSLSFLLAIRVWAMNSQNPHSFHSPLNFTFCKFCMCFLNSLHSCHNPVKAALLWSRFIGDHTQKGRVTCFLSQWVCEHRLPGPRVHVLNLDTLQPKLYLNTWCGAQLYPTDHCFHPNYLIQSSQQLPVACRMDVTISPFCRWENWVQERESDCLKVSG